MEIQLTMAISFISSKDLKETRTMHTRSNNIKIMMGSETNDIIKELFESRNIRRISRISRKIRRISERKRVYF